MAISNHDRVGKALNLLNEGLKPFVEREMDACYGDGWQERAEATRTATGALHWDTQALLKTMWNQWNDVFRNVLGQAERSLVSELITARNKWAHQEAFSTDDVYRTLDSTERLLTAISAPEAQELDKQKQELLRIRFEEQTRKETRRAAGISVEGQPLGGLKPWREVVTPHPDVASGRYQQAEFAADLGQVFRGEGSDEYRDPTEFYRRTYLTEGLRLLLTGALRRLGGAGGDPVVELQTNFGGGKTHSMLALYHLFSGRSAADLPGVEAILQEAGVPQPPQARRSVLVGTALSPANTHPLGDGTVARTLWGVMAHQLLGKEGYALVQASDEAGVSPGSDVLRELFNRASPCLILIDEWVAFVRQVYGINGLPAGSFDANLTFAQALTEAAKAAPGTLVVASIPSSDIEVGGQAGQEALTRLKNTFGRLESAWRPASAEEGFEIVRRRLFQPLADGGFAQRDAVVRAFAEMYRANPQEFPLETRDADYERRMKAAYPVHPELFDRLYQDWSTLDKFQRTRGVLRLMASVIYALWEGEDKSLLIMPATVPVSSRQVQFELTRYMDDPWVPVIEKDVDGPNALPNQLDRDNPNLMRYSACRRVARTLYMGSAPTLNTSHKGLEDRQIRLGCVQAGESIPIFGDALRRLTDQATHLYVDGRRYWYSTQPSVTRLALERAQQRTPDEVNAEITRRLREELKDARQRGDFAAVYVAPTSAGDVPDEREARLVVLGPEHPHTRGAATSKARAQAQALLEQRGAGPRLMKNTLVFLAADSTRLAELEQAVRQFLAWDSVVEEKETLNLDAFQSNQARTKRATSDEAVKTRIPETYQWLLVPEQPDPKGAADWQELRVQGVDGLAIRAGKKLRAEDMLVTQLAGNPLRREIDKIPLWPEGEGHVSVRQLQDYFAQYLYLPRLKNAAALADAVQDGVALMTWAQDSFAYADGYDEAVGRYTGLRAGQIVAVNADGRGLLVKPDVAQRQLDSERPAPAIPTPTPGNGSGLFREDGGGDSNVKPEPPIVTPVVTPRKARRFHGSVALDAIRLGRDAGRIGEEVVQHLTALLGSKARITLEIEVEVADGVPDAVKRTVMENCRTLKFVSQEFEED